MNKVEKELLEDAGRIITRELVANGEVRIAGFGQFRLSAVSASRDGIGDSKKITIKVVRFRPWTNLKNAVRHADGKSNGQSKTEVPKATSPFVDAPPKPVTTAPPKPANTAPPKPVPKVDEAPKPSTPEAPSATDIVRPTNKLEW